MSQIETGDPKMENIKDKEDYMAKKKDCKISKWIPNTSKDEEMKKELMRRKHELEKEAKEKGSQRR